MTGDTLFRIEERRLRDNGRLYATVGFHLELRARCRCGALKPQIADTAGELRRAGGGRHVPCNTRRRADSSATPRHTRGTTQTGETQTAVAALQRCAPDEITAVHVDEAAEPRLPGVETRIEVGAVVENAGLDTPRRHGPERGRLQAEGGTARKQRFPERTVVRTIDGCVDLEAELARPARARDQ